MFKKSKDELSGFIVEDSINEEELFKKSIERQLHDTSLFGCWIFVTEKCNLNCNYCWEKNNNLKGRDMSQDVCNKMLSWLHELCKEKGVKSLYVTLTGGEPFLNFQALEIIVKEISMWEVKATFCIVSNGVALTHDSIIRLSEIGIHTYQITLDGTREIHDKRRCFYSGLGTFKTIINNIWLIAKLDSNAQIIVRINIDDDNVENIPKLLRYLIKIGLNNYVILAMADTIIGCKMPSRKLLDRIVELLSMARNLGFRVLFPEMNHCWMMYDCWLMFNVDGKIYKCPDFVGQTELSVGDVWEGIKKHEYIHQTSFRPWEECLNCEIVGLCRGGCLYRDRFQNNNKKACRKDYIKKLISLKAQWRLEYEDTVDEACCNFFK